MAENSEQSPAKSPWTSDNTFVRSRFIVRRLKRMRSKTRSLSEDVDGFVFPTQEPASLPYELNHPSTSRFSFAEESRQFICCSPEKNVDAIVKDLVNISMENQFRLKEEDVTFEDESVQSLSRKHSASLARSDCNIQRIEEMYEENNNFPGLLGSGISTESLNKHHYGTNLLEEIEDALPKEYSLKRILYCFYSVTMHRALMRLSRLSFLECEKGNALLTHAPKSKETDQQTIEKEISRLDIELMVQKMLMEQAKKALSVSSFAKCTQEGQLEAEKALLLTCMKYEAVERVKDKLMKMDVGDVSWKEESACASIKEIKIAVENPAVWSACELSANKRKKQKIAKSCVNSVFESKIISMGRKQIFRAFDRYNHISDNFIVVAVERDHVKGTEFEYVSQDRTLHFTTPLHFYNLSPNFTIHLYLYGIPSKDSKQKFLYRSNERLNFLHHKSHKKRNSVSSLTTAGHNFTLMGSAVVQRSHFTRTKVTLLTNVGNLSSAMEILLQGDVYLNSLYTGFLDIRYQIHHRECVSTMWTRYWFRLTGLFLQGWPYPFQEIHQDENATVENFQSPTHLIYLNKCTTQAEPEDIFTCARPNTLHFMVENEEGVVRKIQCSADSAQEVETWCYHLNKAITACRIWDS